MTMFFLSLLKVKHSQFLSTVSLEKLVSSPLMNQTVHSILACTSSREHSEIIYLLANINKLWKKVYCSIQMKGKDPRNCFNCFVGMLVIKDILLVTGCFWLPLLLLFVCLNNGTSYTNRGKCWQIKKEMWIAELNLNKHGILWQLQKSRSHWLCQTFIAFLMKWLN